MRLFSLGFVVIAACSAALGQLTLDVTTTGQKSTKIRVWAKQCQARWEFVEGGPQDHMYMLVHDCGKTNIGVSADEKAAFKLGPMESSFAPDIQTSALFMQGNPSVAVAKVADKPGEPILGRPTRYWRFRSTITTVPSVTTTTPDQRITRDLVVMDVDEEFWVDPSIDMPVLDEILQKLPPGAQNEKIRAAHLEMKGIPLRYKRTVVVERNGSPSKEPAYLEEVVGISTDGIPDDRFQWPKDYKYLDLSQSPQ